MDVFQVAQAQAYEGELVLWADQPDAKALARSDLAGTGIGFFFTLFSLFWIYLASQGARHESADLIATIFPLFGLPFLGIGIWKASYPLRAAKLAQNMIYAVTNTRLMIIEPRSVRSFEADKLSDLEREDREDGRGNLFFARETREVRARYGWRKVTTRIGFIGIPEVRRVEELIYKTFKVSP